MKHIWHEVAPPPLHWRYGRGGGGCTGWVLDLDLGADLKAHRRPGVMHDGAPEDSAYRPAMPYDALPGPLTDLPVAPSAFPGRAAARLPPVPWSGRSRCVARHPRHTASHPCPRS